jgi:hypothetical protein
MSNQYVFNQYYIDFIKRLKQAAKKMKEDNNKDDIKENNTSSLNKNNNNNNNNNEKNEEVEVRKEKIEPTPGSSCPIS